MKCKTCETEYALTSATMNFLRASGHTFHCPFGHQWVFSEKPSEADLLRKERDRLKQNAAYLESEAQRLREARDAAERRASAARGQVTKLKKRAANGVCPCCNRTFVDLQRHMATKHAGFLAEEVQGAVGLTIQ